ncbi:hypothetical protein MLD38_000120 [Melastoma candidum]|uniref:Uncharacterized protein n=1 Tax=Melastoma candidum TaxID=119954 RepID=A0ACB9SDY6_9MYRT|nr:hypothetical protein MLD38_000120 [Melastoma candidum]
MEWILLFLPAFLSVYALSRRFLFRSWSPDSRGEASSCAMSLSHGTPAVLLATRSLLLSPGTRSFCSPNSSPDDLVLEFSIAYFLSDLVHLIVFAPSDVLFIAHHLATLFVFLTCRYLAHHGAYELLVLLVMAEVTSVPQNAWTLARIRRSESTSANKVYARLCLPFYTFYSIVRGILAPIFVFKMGAFYMGGGCGGVISRWVWMPWLVVIGGAIGVSILWVYNNWVEYVRGSGRKKRSEKEN